MSLYGALFSGVSGLTAQSSAMGAISDNITNVSTVGYKNTTVNFQTLVTKQTSSTFYSAGGVQSKPRQATDVQGLLQASTSQTDIAISGNGFFVVNEASVPTTSNQYLYTRAGSFIQDDEGYLKNAQGFYLQAWPTNSDGTVKPANDSLTIANQNIISTDYLETVNLNRVGGTATATTTIGIGANLPASDTTGTTHKTDVQFFDTLGNAHSISYVYTKTARENEWDLSVSPPSGTDVLTLEDSSGNAYRSIGQLEFSARPADGSTVVIDGKTYEFDSNASVTPPVAQVRTLTYTGTITAGGGGNVTAAINGTTVTVAAAGSASITTVAAQMALAINQNATINGAVAATSSGGVVTVTSRTAGTAFTFGASTEGATGSFAVADANPTANAGTAGLYQVDTSANTTVANDVASLVAAVIAADSDFDTTNNRVQVSSGSSTTILFTEDGSGQLTVNPAGLLDTSGAAVTTQTSSFNVRETTSGYRDYQQYVFSDVPSTGETLTINGTTYTFLNTETSNDNDTNIRIDTLTNMLADLEASIEANDAQFSGSTVRTRANGNDAGYTNTLVLENLSAGSYSAVFSAGFGANVTEPDGTSIVTAAGAAVTSTVNKSHALTFNSAGIPSAFNVAEVEILGFANGAANMDDDAANSPQMTIDFGTVGEANGMTQYGAQFTPVFITQNGSQFGTFAGLTVDTDGIMTALFDNGETRKIFKLPIATFVNPNSLEGRTGNVWNATQASGDYTLREADNGPAGQVIQGALEASTVDIGTEFTNMIVVQRAYSASTKIISTADEMLEELMRTKR